MIVQKMTNNSNEGDRKLSVNLQNYKNSLDEPNSMDKHLMHALQGGDVASAVGTGRTENTRPGAKANPALTSRSGLRSTPQHLLVSFYTLRYMKSRDNKTKILYALNFCRAI